MVVGALGCGNNDEDPKAYLNAPESKVKISKQQAGLDRGMTPEEMKAMEEPFL